MDQPQAILLDAERAIKLHARPDKGRFGEDGLDINTAVKIIEILRDELVKALAVDPTEVARAQGEIVSAIYEWPQGEDHEREATVYWCPRCDVQSDGLHHFCERGPAMFPQLDEYTKCHVIHVEVMVPDE